MSQVKNKRPTTPEEANKALMEALKEHRRKLETDEEYRRETEKYRKAFEQVKFLVGESEE